MVPELDVLLATVRWLCDRKVPPACVSVARGSDAGRYADRDRLNALLSELGVTACGVTSDGPDVVASGAGELWLVECKGEGSGVGATQRNNFDRALASAVSYYGLTPHGIDASAVSRRLIALALPATAHYTRELKRRVRVQLRTRLDMWVLLVDPGTHALSAIAPQDEFAF